MDTFSNSGQDKPAQQPPCSCCTDSRVADPQRLSLSRRGFLQGVGCAATVAAVAGSSLAAETRVQAACAAPAPGTSHPCGTVLRVKPVLLCGVPARREKDSFRWYGGIQTADEVRNEARRLERDMQELARGSDFPIEFLPLGLVDSEEKAKEVAACSCDVLLMFGACFGARWEDWRIPSLLTASNTPSLMFVRHRTEPYYFWHEAVQLYLLRDLTDAQTNPNMDAQDIVVDDYQEILWRLRALYGLKNSRGTKMLAIGGLQHYSAVGAAHGPQHAQEVWDYTIEVRSLEEFGQRLQQSSADQSVVDAVEQQTRELLAQPNVTLKTDRKFVFNSFMALWTVKELMKETGATNFGMSPCMGNPVIGLLDTPPCLVLALANDEGYTAYCHTDLTHTVPGVLLRWIAGRPTFLCNTHFPHDGVFTVAHCAAPRKMNGKDYESTDIMTHYESDYGAATKVHYAKGQTVTVVIPALDCSKWQGFRGKIVDVPARPACRSQMDIEIEGDWHKLQSQQVGFHAQVVYGDYLREVGYALKKMKKPAWETFSET